MAERSDRQRFLSTLRARRHFQIISRWHLLPFRSLNLRARERNRKIRPSSEEKIVRNLTTGSVKKILIHQSIVGKNRDILQSVAGKKNLRVLQVSRRKIS